MSNEVSIFKQSGAVSTATRRGQTALGQSLAQQNTMRRIATNTNLIAFNSDTSQADNRTEKFK